MVALFNIEGWKPDSESVARYLQNLQAAVAVILSFSNIPGLQKGAAAAAQNTAIIQGAISAGGDFAIRVPGTYQINSTILIPSGVSIYLGAGVVVQVASGSTSAMAFRFQNATNSRLWGPGTVDFNTRGGTGAIAPYHGIVFGPNAANCFVGGGITLQDSKQYTVFGYLNTNCVVDDINVQAGTFGGIGVNGVFFAGNSFYPTVRNVKGVVTDDAVVMNVRDIPALANQFPGSVGPIVGAIIDGVYTSNTVRTGAGVNIYAAFWDSGIYADATLGAPPVITALGNAVSGLVTATTDKAHGMSVGSTFKIASANPSTYNTSEINGYARVIEVPSATTFKYSSTGTAYVGSAVLTINFDCRDISVSNVHTTNTGSVQLSLSNTSDDAAQRGVITSLTARNIRGKAFDPGSATVVSACSINFVTTIDLEIDGIECPVVNAEGGSAPSIFGMQNNAYLGGKTLIRRAKSVASMTSDAAATPIINIVNGDHVIIDRAELTTLRYTLGNFYSVIANNIKFLQVENSIFTASPQQEAIALGLFGSTANLVWRGNVVDGYRRGISLDISFNTAIMASIAQSRFANVYDIPIADFGSGDHRFMVDGVTNISSTNPLFGGGNAALQLSITISGFETDKADPQIIPASFTRSSLKIYGMRARVDVTQVDLAPGSIVFNTNTAAGTLAAQGLVTCQSTTWVRLDNTSLHYP